MARVGKRTASSLPRKQLRDNFALCLHLLFFRCRRSWRSPPRIHIGVAIDFSPWKSLISTSFPGVCRRVVRSLRCSFPEPPTPHPPHDAPGLDVRQPRKTFGKKMLFEPHGRDEDPSFPSSFSKKNSMFVNSCGSQWEEDLVLMGSRKTHRAVRADTECPTTVNT